MTTFTSKFNVGDKAFYVIYEVSLEDAFDADLYSAVKRGISSSTIKRILIDKNGLRYELDNEEIKRESALFSTEAEALLKSLSSFRDNLKEALKRAEDLIQDYKKDPQKFIN